MFGHRGPSQAPILTTYITKLLRFSSVQVMRYSTEVHAATPPSSFLTLKKLLRSLKKSVPKCVQHKMILKIIFKKATKKIRIPFAIWWRYFFKVFTFLYSVVWIKVLGAWGVSSGHRCVIWPLNTQTTVLFHKKNRGDYILFERHFASCVSVT